MQQHQHHKIILNQPQKICTSTQNHLKDKSVMNNFQITHLYITHRQIFTSLHNYFED